VHTGHFSEITKGNSNSLFATGSLLTYGFLEADGAGEGDIAGDVGAAGETVAEGEAAGSVSPPPHAPKVEAMPRTRRVARTLVFIVELLTKIRL
jgi:hypothetical protein